MIGDDQHGSADQTQETSFIFSKKSVLQLEDPEAGRAYYLAFNQAQNVLITKITFHYKK